MRNTQNERSKQQTSIQLRSLHQISSTPWPVKQLMSRLAKDLRIVFDPAYVVVAAKRLVERRYAPLASMLPE